MSYITPRELAEIGRRAAKRRTSTYLIEGEHVTYAQIARRLGIDSSTAQCRMKAACLIPGPVTWARLSALDASDAPTSMGVVRRQARRVAVPPAVVVTIDPKNLQLAAQVIANKVRTCVNGEPCHVFVSPALQVFVLPETHLATREWLRDRFAWYLGLYRRRTQYTEKDMAITLDLKPSGIEEDLVCHLRDLAPPA